MISILLPPLTLYHFVHCYEFYKPYQFNTLLSLSFSAKRCELYKGFVHFTDSNALKLLRYCSTRWLRFLTCIQRVLNQWAVSQAYFESHDDVFSYTFYSHDFSSISPQSAQGKIQKLEREMCKLVERFLGYLVPAMAIMDIPLKEIQYGKENQLADEDLFTGTATKELIRNEDLTPTMERRFFQWVHCCFLFDVMSSNYF